jgi:hypothetical protein
MTARLACSCTRARSTIFSCEPLPELNAIAIGVADLRPCVTYANSGNLVDGDIDILKLDADKLTKVANLALPGI